MKVGTQQPDQECWLLCTPTKSRGWNCFVMCVTHTRKLFPDGQEVYWALVYFDSQKVNSGSPFVYGGLARGVMIVCLVNLLRLVRRSLRHVLLENVQFAELRASMKFHTSQRRSRSLHIEEDNLMSFPGGGFSLARRWRLRARKVTNQALDSRKFTHRTRLGVRLGRGAVFFVAECQMNRPK